jgi:hypothetical protein
MEEGVKELEYAPFPVTPRREEGKNVEIKEEIPSPSTGEGQGGGENGIFSQLGRVGDEFKAFIFVSQSSCRCGLRSPRAQWCK